MLFKNQLFKKKTSSFNPKIAYFSTKIIQMKNWIVGGLFVLGFQMVNAQKVYSVKYESQANVKVYVVNYESQADLLVYKVSYESQAGDNNGKWYFTDYESQAKKKIYFVNYESQAD